MNIKIIGVGKLKEKYFRDGIAEYLKRMDKFAKVKIVEVADEKAPENLSEAEMADVKVKEGDRILGKIKIRNGLLLWRLKASSGHPKFSRKKSPILEPMGIPTLLS